MALLFLLTLLVFMAGVYFPFKVPTKQLELVTAERDVLLSQHKEFEALLSKSHEIYKRYRNASSDAMYYDDLDNIRKILPDLLEVNKDTSTVVSKFGRTLNDSYRELLISKELANKCAQKKVGASEIEDQLVKAESLNREIQRDLDACRKTLAELSSRN